MTDSQIMCDKQQVIGFAAVDCSLLPYPPLLFCLSICTIVVVALVRFQILCL